MWQRGATEDLGILLRPNQVLWRRFRRRWGAGSIGRERPAQKTAAVMSIWGSDQSKAGVGRRPGRKTKEAHKD